MSEQTIVHTNVTEPPSLWSGSVGDNQQRKAPIRIGIATALGAMLWLGPYLGVNAVLLPAKVEALDPSNKAAIVALLSGSAMVFATLSNIIIGGLSDLTRSRWGRRTPWLVAGSIGAFIMLLVFNVVSTVPLMVVSWCVYQIFLNAIVAPLIAVIADRCAPRYRGLISSIYAFGYVIGQYGGQLLGAQFLGPKVSTGIVVMSVLTLCAGPIAVLIMREKSSLGMPKKRFTWAMFVQHFIFPVRDCRDFYLALFGKMMVNTATTAIMGYQLYILGDYIGLDTAGQQRCVSIISMLLMVTAIVMSLVAGPISDRIHSRKIPVAFAALLVAVGVAMPMISSKPWTMVVYGAVAGLGMGIFFAVDQALNIEVLPNEANAAKDLGILNLANTGSQLLGPILAAAIVTIDHGSYYLLFPVCAALSLIGGVMVLLIRCVK